MLSMDDEPDWAHRARHIPHKPEWADRIPEDLSVLGEVFFPIPSGVKGWNYAHHIDSNRYSWDSETLNAYLEQGWNYGIACASDLVVIDIDELEYKGDIISSLPPTLYQTSGSGAGIHIFYLCPGVNKRRTFYVHICPDCGTDLLHSDFNSFTGTVNGVEQEIHYCSFCETEYDSETFEKKHIGELKADPNGYVVGPDSKHPSGNRYGPLRGDGITEIDPEVLGDALRDFVKEPKDRTSTSSADSADYGVEDNHEFYELEAGEVLPRLEPEERVSHPVHGSSTGTNFMMNEGGYTFVCWRCDYRGSQGCVLNAQHYLALEAVGHQYGDFACKEVRKRWGTDSTLHYKAWLEAVEDGFIGYETIPYTVVKGFMVEQEEIDEDEELYNRREAENILKYQINTRLSPQPDG